MKEDYEREYEAIVGFLSSGDANEMKSAGTASIVINENKVLGISEVQGISIKATPSKQGVRVRLEVKDNAVIEKPVHLCFGMLPQEGKQVIESDFVIGKNSRVRFLSHCLFPNAKNIEHVMDFRMRVEEGASVDYFEEHFHPEQGGITVKPRLRAVLEDKAVFNDEFKVIHGRTGLLELDYEVKQGKGSSCNLMTKAYGKQDDSITIKESLYLNGEKASGTAKSRVVLTSNAKALVLGEVEGNAAFTRGHVDCHEVVQGEQAKAEAVPRIAANHPLARITHEASIGRINKKEIETLMSRGLTEEQATDFIVNGLLK